MFSQVSCHSVRRGVGGIRASHASWDMSHGGVTPPPIRPGTYPLPPAH